MNILIPKSHLHNWGIMGFFKCLSQTLGKQNWDKNKESSNPFAMQTCTYAENSKKKINIH